MNNQEINKYYEKFKSLFTENEWITNMKSFK